MSNGRELTANRVFSADEAGFDLNKIQGYIICKRGVKTPYLLSSGNRTHISVMSCLNACGVAINPAFLIPGKKTRPKFLDSVFQDAWLRPDGGACVHWLVWFFREGDRRHPGRSKSMAFTRYGWSQHSYQFTSGFKHLKLAKHISHMSPFSFHLHPTTSWRVYLSSPQKSVHTRNRALEEAKWAHNKNRRFPQNTGKSMVFCS